MLPACDDGGNVLQYPRAVNGVIDLRDWDFEQNGVIALDGDYLFFWREFVPPSKLPSDDSTLLRSLIEVPGIWNNKPWQGRALPDDGFASYQLTLLMPPSAEDLSLKLLDMATAFRLYVNGTLVSTSGHPADVSGENRPVFRPHVAELPQLSDTLNLIIHVASYEHYKSGVWEQVLLGRTSHIRDRYFRLFIYAALLFAALFAIGLYNLFIGIYKRKEPATLAFGGVCMLFALRTICVDQRLIMHEVPQMPWWLLNKLEYLTFTGGEMLYALFFYFLFRKDFPRIGLQIILAVSGLFSLIILVLPVRIFSDWIIYYQFFTGGVLLFGCWIIGRCILHRRPQAGFFAVAMVPFFFLVVVDLFAMQGIVHYPQISPIGIFLFVLLNAYLLAVRHLSAYQALEEHRAALQIANDDYQHELKERLQAEAENHRLQEKLNRSQKMEALGLLAGGVAHDLNNVLTGVVSYPDLILLDMDENHPLHKPLSLIRSSGRKAAAIVQDLLALARRNITHLAATDLNALVKEYLGSAEYQMLIKYHPAVAVSSHLDSLVPPIRGSEVHLRKTLMNLVSNAAESQPSGGCIRVATERRYLEQDYHGYEIIPTGEYVVLRVEDEGVGLSGEEMRRMFEPFYTKKVMGRSGTGLGMAVIWGTVRDHEGYIDIVSRVDHGTTIELYFCPSEDKVKPQQAPLPVISYSGNGEEVLIIDDLESQRDIASSIMTRLGYVVTARASGEEAIEYLRFHRPHMVILDMIMEPGMDGLDTFKKIREIDEDLVVVIASGYAETDRVREALELGARAYLRKPYSVEMLGITIREHLHQASSEA